MIKKLLCITSVIIGLVACKGPGSDDMGAGSWLNGKNGPSFLADNVPDTVYFHFDSSSITHESMATLKKQAEWWTHNSEKPMLVVEGHADDRGTRNYNLALGERRAHATKKYLVSQGVPAAKIETVSYGKERPAEIGSGEEVWSKNRRTATVRSH